MKPLNMKLPSELDLEAKGSYVTRRGHVGGLEDDEDKLEDVLFKLETSYGELDGPCDAATMKRRKRKPCANFYIKDEEGKIKKLEIKLWNLKVKGTDVLSYNQHFQELALIYSRMFPEEFDEDPIEFATELMDKKIHTFADRQAKNKRKLNEKLRSNHNQQQPFKRQNVARAYTAGPGEKKVYRGSKPLCPKCNYHHDGQCASKSTNCKRTSHLARDCRSPAAAGNNQRALGANQRVVTCFECGAQGYFKRDCLKLKNNNRGNQAGNGGATSKAYAVGNAGKNPDANVVTGTFLLNNRYASILFDTSADRSFVSTAFSSLIDIIPTALDNDYDVEQPAGK
ncbi:putative reverse transcriptase domain-containing protein [Tanacetum coccineum]